MDLQLVALCVTGDAYAVVSEQAAANGGVRTDLAQAQILMALVAGLHYGRCDMAKPGGGAGLPGFAEGLALDVSRDTLASQIASWGGVVYEQTTRKEIAKLMQADARAARGLLVEALAPFAGQEYPLPAPLISDGLVRVARGGRTSMERLEPIRCFETAEARVPYDLFLAYVGYNFVAGVLINMQITVWADN